jgi:hypothetical protein
MNCTRAALSRGLRTTVPDSEADDDTGPSDRAPAGTRGVAPTRTIPGELAAAGPDPIATGSTTSTATRAARVNPLATTASTLSTNTRRVTPRQAPAAARLYHPSIPLVNRYYGRARGGLARRQHSGRWASNYKREPVSRRLRGTIRTRLPPGTTREKLTRRASGWRSLVGSSRAGHTQAPSQRTPAYGRAAASPGRLVGLPRHGGLRGDEGSSSLSLRSRGWSG